MRQGRCRATRGMAACQLCSGVVVLGLFFLFADVAAAQQFPRRPQRPARPGMNRRAPAANPAGSAAAANSGASSGGASAIKNLADPNSPAPELWKVKPDPATEQPAEITQNIQLHVPPSFFGGEVVYPTAPSVFVAVGRNGDQKDVREIWDLSTRKRVGALRGGVKLDKPYALMRMEFTSPARPTEASPFTRPGVAG